MQEKTRGRVIYIWMVAILLALALSATLAFTGGASKKTSYSANESAFCSSGYALVASLEKTSSASSSVAVSIFTQLSSETKDMATDSPSSKLYQDFNAASKSFTKLSKDRKAMANVNNSSYSDATIVKTGDLLTGALAEARSVIAACSKSSKYYDTLYSLTNAVSGSNVSSANKEALTVGDDAVAIAAMRNLAPTVANLRSAVSETSGVSLIAVGTTEGALKNAEINVSESGKVIGVCLSFKGTINAPPTISKNCPG
jgi:hypothetical protein